MYSNRLYSPLRYPGGKVRFAPFVADLMRANDLHGGVYCEPYAGGAAIALDLLFSGTASHVHINDLDEAVNAFWVAVVEYPDDLLKLLRDRPITMEEWHRCKATMVDSLGASPAERGFATLFLNRTNRSGILKAGVIGGKAQAGLYTLAARFNKERIASRIERVAERAKDISVYCEDAAAFLVRMNAVLPARSLTYLDPPYYVKGQGLYRNYYAHADHEEIATILQSGKFSGNWLVSYDDTGSIRTMYRASNGLTYGLYYSAQARYSGSEVMFLSQGLTAPRSDCLPSNSNASWIRGQPVPQDSRESLAKLKAHTALPSLADRRSARRAAVDHPRSLTRPLNRR